MKPFNCEFTIRHLVAKVGIVFLSVSLNSSQTFSQSFTLDDLVKIVNEEDSFFDTIAVKKGYKKYDNQGTKGRYYRYYEQPERSEYYIYKSYFVDPDILLKGVKVTFQSCDKDDSVSMKKRLKSMRFKYTKTIFDTSEYGNVITANYFRKSNIEFMLRSGKFEDGGVIDENTKVYEFRATKQSKVK